MIFSIHDGLTRTELHEKLRAYELAHKTKVGFSWLQV
jgi:hypothetical protein